MKCPAQDLYCDQELATCSYFKFLYSENANFRMFYYF